MLPFPVIDNDELAKIRHINRDGDMPGFITHVVRGLYDVEGGGAALRRAPRRDLRGGRPRRSPAARASSCSPTGTPTAELAPIPSLLLTGAVHHHLVREKTRTQVGLVVEAGDVREVHHVALLIGYGAAAVNPYLAMETVEDLARDGVLRRGRPRSRPSPTCIKALGKGVLKVMSKMGISTVASYRGAQIFEAVGLSQELVDEYFTGTASQLGGIGLDVDRRGGRAAGTRRPTRATASRRRTASSRSAASTSGAARASRTCSTPRPSSGCSTPPGSAATTSSRSTPSASTSSPSGS